MSAMQVSTIAGADPKRVRFRVNAGYLLANQFVSSIVPFAATTYLSRTLGPTQFGVVALTQTLAVYAVLVVSWALDLSVTNFIAARRGDANYVQQSFQTGWALQWILTAMAITLVFLAQLTPLWDRLGASALGLVGLMLVAISFPSFFIYGVEAFPLIARKYLLIRLVAIPLMVIFVRDPSHTTRLWILFTAVGVVAGSTTVIELYRNGIATFGKVRFSEITAMMKSTSGHFVSALLVGLPVGLGVLTLGAVRGTEEVAIFTIANQARLLMQIVMVPLSVAFFPRVSEMYVMDPLKAARTVRRALRLVILAAGLFGVALLFLAPVVVRLLSGGSYSAATGVLRIFAVMPLLTAVSGLLGTQTLVPNRRVREYKRPLMIGAVASLILLVPVAHVAGAAGVALLAVILELYVCVSCFRAVRRFDLLGIHS
jgi:polysaccharide transporter, PST family